MSSIYKAILSGEGCTPVFALLLLIIIGLGVYIIRLWKDNDAWKRDYKDISEKYHVNATRTSAMLEHIKEVLNSIQHEMFRR